MSIEENTNQGIGKSVYLIPVWCILVFIFAGWFFTRDVSVEINGNAYFDYATDSTIYVVDWADETRNDARYTMVMQEDGWLGRDLKESDSPNIYIAIRTPHGSLYRLPSINATTRDVAATVTKLSEEFDATAYVMDWSTYKKKGILNGGIPDNNGLSEDAEFIKTKLQELSEDLQSIKDS